MTFGFVTKAKYFYCSVMWSEHRIWTNNSLEPDFWYPVSLEFLQDLWIPNVFIYNLKSFSSLQVLKRLAGEKLHILHIYHLVFFLQASG